MGLNKNEAPTGFYAALKPKYSPTTGNICRQCDARSLCQENKNDWCRINRCMPYEVICNKTGAILKRVDGCSVVFKKVLGDKNVDYN